MVIFLVIVTLKNGAYVINLDEFADIGIHGIALFCRKTEIVYLDSFGVEHVPEEIIEFVGNKDIKPNIYLSKSKQFSNVWALLHWIY